ncbi:MAG: sigma-70 family RNA polymerase sigma factor [Calditrichaceae bacterium]|nr:sigma-70 family RNA polymerase sigma factor [Calditrichaceae bacterium]MBN2710435.1 sigma-70 family RNA polymerase sigma factor [Calditrichaceae bacterium]RQV93628.1 MAG: sigma-70 family RNA polymerase sigma factor [Calditrichota bacterium]
MAENKQREFSELIEPHISSLYSTALRMTRNQNDAEDLVQDTLYKAYKALAQYQRNTNFRAWIFRILVNTFITAYRKAVKQPQKVSYDDLEEFFLYKRLDETVSIQETSKEEFLESMFDDDVKEALEALPYQFRLVVLLCDVEGFSYNEIANIIDAPLGTVMSRLYRGRKLLQRQLWDYAKKRGYINDDFKAKV